MTSIAPPDLPELAQRIRSWARALGFDALGISKPDLQLAESRLSSWLTAGYQGSMGYMSRHGARRTRPAALVPGTLRVISVSMRCLPAGARAPEAVLADGRLAYIARYALGRDYHRTMRRQLQRLADQIAGAIGAFGYRVFVDSAPVMEKPIAEQAGLGWIGKHTNLLSREAGSAFLLGELYTDLALPADEPASNHCGSCRACIDACPTGAIVGPYVLDARRCISYLTIENRGPIPEALREPLGNRIFGCDDCQLVCPWDRYARTTTNPAFAPRHGLDAATLTSLFGWDEATWEARTRGSPLRRSGYVGWLRNLAVALGNAPSSPEIRAALEARRDHESALVREHVAWALARHAQPGAAP